jgi:dipeptidyl aminopeptidase/acylaminoacyl peptidase
MDLVSCCATRQFGALTKCLAISCLLILASKQVTPQARREPTSAIHNQRAVTVPDAVRMTRLGDHAYYYGASSEGRVAHFSPNSKSLVVVLRKGNLERNTNEYEMLLWQTDKLFARVAPKIILSMSSSSNRQAIEDIKWLKDNRTLTFLGEKPGELHQLYKFDTDTRLLTRITNESTNVLSYSSTDDLSHIALVVEEPTRSIWDSTTRRRGLVLSTQWPFQVVEGKSGGAWWGNDRLIIYTKAGSSRWVPSVGKISDAQRNPFLSPNGRYVLIPVQVNSLPDSWGSYTDQFLHELASQSVQPGQYSQLQRLILVDTSMAKVVCLLNSPLPPRTEWQAAWSPDSRTVVLTNVYLPLDGTLDDGERRARQNKVFTVEVNIPNGEISKISTETLKFVQWAGHGDELVLQTGRLNAEGSPFYARFHRVGNQWEKVSEAVAKQTSPMIELVEDMNTPPRLYASDSRATVRSAILDLNPWFTNLRFARVEEIQWQGLDGGKIKAGLYYPLDYDSRTKYPLVIQTHDWNRNRFWIDGPWTTAFAAQPLAAKNIMVLQLGESYEELGTPEEMRREIARVEGSIDYLQSRGMIDLSRIGIIGFSRTCLFVKYLLTHSKYHFAAASETDGVDAGYYQYILSINSDPGYSQFAEGVNGGPPFGDGLKSWIERSPGFNIQRVTTPLLITAENPLVALYDWEWFAMLRRLGKPVEMILMEDGEHILEKPWERIVSQQGNVDWFAFWLKDEQDPDPGKAAQYTRWKAMREGLTASSSSGAGVLE